MHRQPGGGRRWCWFVLFFLFSSGLPAQERSIPLRHLVVSTWTTERGLPQDFISSIRQTPDGFLWVGTYGGLARFDGLHFRTFIQEVPALRGRINCLEVDRDGHLWIGTSNGLFYYRDHVFQAVLAGGRPLKSVLQLRPRGAGGVWIRTSGEVLYGLPGGAVPYPLPVPFAAVLDLNEDAGGRLWLVTQDTVTSLRTTVSVPLQAKAYPLKGVKTLYCAHDGRVYAGDWRTVYLLQNGGFAPQFNKPKLSFIEMLVDRENHVWTASGGAGGLTRLSSGGFEQMDADTGLASSDVRTLFEDRDGDLWVGTVAGLQRLHRGIFTSYTAQDGLAAGHHQYDALFQDQAGTVWVGSSSNGLASFQDGRWKVYGPTQGVVQGQVRGFAGDGIKPVFSLGGVGLFAWHGGAGAGRFEKLLDRPGDYLTSPVRTGDGSLWFSIPRKGVFRLRDRIVTQFGPEQGLSDDTVWSLTEDKSGQLWAGATTGLFLFKDQHWSRITTSVPIFGILPAQGGGLYLATLAGLTYRNGEKSWTVTQQEGLPSDTVYGTSEDAHGDLWATTAFGICRIPKGQLEALHAGKARSVTPEIYTSADGLMSRGVLPLGQETLLRAHDGKLWFATTTAPSMAEPSGLEAPAPEATLDEIQVDDHRHLPSRLQVGPGRHRIAFLFTAPSYLAPEQIRFRYRLTGWDTSWIDAGTSREAEYAGLPPGKYSFQVQALGRTGITGPVSPATAIELRPFFWQTRIFVVAMCLLAVLLVVEITRRQTSLRAERLNARFQERASERERIALQIHDTFVQDLVGTALQLELLALQLEDDPVGAQTLLEQLTNRLRGMVGRSRDMISNLHSMASPDQDLIDLLRPLEAEFRLAELPEYRVEQEGEQPGLTPYARDQIYGICREAVANAFRHANANTILVVLRLRDEEVSIVVRDDGRGMSEELLQHGRQGHFGLRGMRAHALLIGAELAIATAPGAGTSVTLVLDTRRARPEWWMRRLGQIFSRATSKAAAMRRKQAMETRGETHEHH